MKISFKQNLLRTTALTVVLIGVVGSLYFMFNAGSNQKSVLLLGLFTAWVVSPFAGLFVANKISNSWKYSVRASLYWLMILLTIGSLASYSGALIPPDTKPAFIFLVIPFTSWLLIGSMLLLAKRISNKGNDTNQTQTKTK